MSYFEEIVEKVILDEGGATITNDHTDRGGLTKYGISKKAFPKVDIKNLTKDQAKKIYYDNYWIPIKGDSIESKAVAYEIFDGAVNQGIGTTIKLVQRVLGTVEDGLMGNNTLKLLNDMPIIGFLNAFKIAKIERYIRICESDSKQKKFFYGWVKRTIL